MRPPAPAARTSRHGADVPAPSRQARTPGATRTTPPTRLRREALAPAHAARQKSLARTVTEFFSRLRPSNRPERGGTRRGAAERDDSPERAPRHQPPPSPAGCHGTTRPHSLDRGAGHHWSTPTVMRPRAHSASSARRKAVPSRRRSPGSLGQRSPRRETGPVRAPSAALSRPHDSHILFGPPPPLPPRRAPPTATTTQLSPPRYTPIALAPRPPRPPTPTPTPTTRTAFPPDQYESKRAHRQHRRTLISSGDFLGVTGANPCTGEPDVVTPPTSSDDAVVTSSTSSTGPAAATRTTGGGASGKVCAGGRGREGGQERDRDKEARRAQREEERLSRAEQRKERVREELVQSGVRWRREEGGWSSVAVRPVSPVRKVPSGTGIPKGSPVRSEGFGVSPATRGSFLGMAAVAERDGCHRREVAGMMGMVLGQRRRAGQSLRSPVEGSEFCPAVRTMNPCKPPALITGREGFLRQGPSRRLALPPEWELGNLVIIPLDLRRLLEDGRVGRISWGEPELNGADSLDSQPRSGPRADSTDSNLSLDQALPSACTRTTTTTGSARSRPRSRAAQPSGATLDGSQGAPLTRRAPAAAAISQTISTLSPTGASSYGCLSQLGPPDRMQLSVWRSVKKMGLQMAASALVRRAETGRAPESHTRHRHPGAEPGAGSATTSLRTDREAAARGAEPGPTEPLQARAADEQHRPRQRQQPDRAMRTTMRTPSGPDHDHYDDAEAGPRRSSRTSTRTSTSGAALSPRERQDHAETMARDAARRAFAQHGAATQGPSAWVPRRMPIPASESGSHHRGVRAAGTGAKPGAKTAAVPGTGPGVGKGTEEEGSPELQRWLRNAVAMLAKVVGAYWQVVSPVFDGESELRRRVARAQGTRGDVIVCTLAAVFLFLVISIGMWVVRGVVWVFWLLGGLGQVLGAVAGL